MTATRPSTDAPAVWNRLGVLAWDGAETEHDHDPRSPYVESFWLPILGPSTVLLLRRLADEFDRTPGGFEIDCAELSTEIGLGRRITARAPFIRTLDRCVKFNLAELRGDVLHVRRTLPTLSRGQAAKLSLRLRERHERWRAADDDRLDRRATIIRAAHVAHTLLALGDAPHDVERQLQRWDFPPSVAGHAMHWAETGELAAM